MFINIHFNKILYFLKKLKKNGQNSAKDVKKCTFVTKITNTFDFSSQTSKKKISRFFLGLFTWNHPTALSASLPASEGLGLTSKSE